ncbi:MAG: phycobilisome rod-core linker polypeptide [Leptolyngbyaceae cyanobacterium]
MVSTLTNSASKSGAQIFNVTEPFELWPNDSLEKIEVIIRAVYRQVLGNAHVMESERLVVPESQLKYGEISGREFVCSEAIAELYRSLFADSCYRYRTMELNFKHLLGRAPQSFEELRAHSNILDTEGYEADIDSYIDSDEYNNAFGENIVPYNRGYRTVTGQTMLGFTNMMELTKSISSSDKNLANNAPRVANQILRNQTGKLNQSRDAQDILGNLFRRTPVATPPTPAAPAQSTAPSNEQDALIAKLRQQLDDLRTVANIGRSVLRKGVTQTSSDGYSPKTKAALIERLQGELMEARALATIGEARLNKWRRR